MKNHEKLQAKPVQASIELKIYACRRRTFWTTTVCYKCYVCLV